MIAPKLSVYILSFLCLGLCLGVSAAEFQGVPVPENASIVLAVAAEGVQIYESKTNSTGAYEWALKAPEAELKSLTGEVLGKHFAGPSWALSDGSQCVGNLPPLKSAPSPDAGSIPWLLLGTKTRSEAGLLSKIDYVVRIATSGGAAPTEAPKNPSDTARVKYHAIYLFLKKQ